MKKIFKYVVFVCLIVVFFFFGMSNTVTSQEQQSQERIYSTVEECQEFSELSKSYTDKAEKEDAYARKYRFLADNFDKIFKSCIKAVEESGTFILKQ